MEGIQYTLMVIVGPVLLLAVILFVVLRNRTTRAQDASGEKATRELYKQASAEDEARTP